MRSSALRLHRPVVIDSGMWSFLRRLFGLRDADASAAGASDGGAASGKRPTAGTGSLGTPTPLNSPLTVAPGRVQAGGVALAHDERFVPDTSAVRFSELPSWGAPLENVEQLNSFVALVHRYFSLRKIESKLEDGRVVAADPAFSEEGATDESDGAANEPRRGVERDGRRAAPSDGASTGNARAGDGRLHRFGLWNLMQICAGTPRDEWAGMVAAHFDSVRRAPDVERRFSARLASLETAREHLVLRVFDQAHLPEEVQRESVARREVPGLVTLVVVDFPETCRSLQRKEAAAWGASDEDVWAAAMENTPRLAKAEMRTIGDHASPIRILSGDSIYVASLIHTLESVPEVMGVYGGFVSVPTRGTLLALPFDGPEAMRSLALFVAMTNQLESMGPGSVSKRVWWADREGPQEISYRLNDRQIEISRMPESLQELLITLGSGPGVDEQERA